MGPTRFTISSIAIALTLVLGTGTDAVAQSGANAGARATVERAPADDEANPRNQVRQMASELVTRDNQPGSTNGNASVSDDSQQRRLADQDRMNAGGSSEADSQTRADRVAATLPDNERLALGEPAPDSANDANANSDSGGSLMDGGSSWMLSTIASLGLVIGLILATRWGYQKLCGKVVHNQHPAIEVLGRTAVAPKNHVVLLRVGQRVLVVSDSPSGLNTLANVDDSEEVAELLQAVATEQDQSISQSFQSLVQRFNGEYDGKAMADAEGLDHEEHHYDRARDSVSGLLSKVRVMTGQGGSK